MERATHYRALSAQGALVGGLLSLGAGLWMAWRDAHGLACFHCELTVWLIVLGATTIANVLFLWRDDRRRGEKIFSPRALWAVRALAPSFVLAGLVTLILLVGDPNDAGGGMLFSLGFIWSAAYALGLLAASHFAPRSILLLGRAFFVAVVVAILSPQFVPGIIDSNPPLSFELFMAATFGLFHLVYALLTWPRSGVASADV
jgi:hypothetical protein